jgi:hypothetical protein
VRAASLLALNIRKLIGVVWHRPSLNVDGIGYR